LLLVALNLVLTSQAQPYGGEKKAGLQRLEHVLLGCLCLTLWAGSVFNSHSRCEAGDGTGTTLAWCDFLSVVIGLVDFAAGVGALLYFLHLKGVCTCLGKCVGKVQVVGTAIATCMRQRTLAQQQAVIRQRTVDAADTTTWSNPSCHRSSLQEIELRCVSASAKREEDKKKRTSATGRDLLVVDMHVNPRRNVDDQQHRPASLAIADGGESGGERKNTDAHPSSRQ